MLLLWVPTMSRVVLESSQCAYAVLQAEGDTVNDIDNNLSSLMTYSGCRTATRDAQIRQRKLLQLCPVLGAYLVS